MATSNPNSAPTSAPGWQLLLVPMMMLGLLHAGAIFGFFYAWVCSTMWGLDTADPNVAIAAMQAMNESVRNPVFAPAFFGTPLVLAASALLAWKAGSRPAAVLCGLGAVLHVAGAMVPTMAIHVPMNEALAMVETPLDGDQAQSIWQAYSAPWQTWNTVRAVVSGIALVSVALGILTVHLRPRQGIRPAKPAASRSLRV